MQLNQTYRIIAATLGLIAVVVGIWFFSTIVFYILGAAVFAIMGKPIVHGIERLKIRYWRPKRWLSALIALVLLMVIVGGIVGLILPIVLDKMRLISSYSMADIANMLRQPLANIEHTLNFHFPEAQISVRDVLHERLSPLFESDMLSNTVGTIFSAATEIAMAIFCITFITYFFLKDETMFNNWITMLFPSRYEQNVRRAMENVTRLLIRYFIGISIESIIKLIFVTLPLYFMGIDLSTALIIGLISAILNVIPYVGPLMGGIIGIIIALIDPIAGVSVAGIVVRVTTVLLVFQLIDNVVLQPYIYASSVKAHPLEIFIVILMAGYIAGVMGMLLAIPAYTVLRVFAKEFFSNFRIVKKITDSI